MEVQLLKARQVVVDGEPRNLKPGDWVSIGRQAALRWIAEGIARAPHLPKAGLLPYGCGLWDISTKGGAMLQQVETDYQIATQQMPLTTELPFMNTVIWHSDLKLRPELLVPGFILLNTWQMAFPLWDYDTLAQDIGTTEAQERTVALVHDLRIPVPNPNLVFIRRTAITQSFMATWMEERETGDDDRLCFLRAWHQVKPLALPLPYTWGLAKDEDKYDQQR